MRLWAEAESVTIYLQSSLRLRNTHQIYREDMQCGRMFVRLEFTSHFVDLDPASTTDALALYDETTPLKQLVKRNDFNALDAVAIQLK